ncbi:MAG TPA: tyrosine-type recombinase/integrase [Terriglobales bacterium]|nr:tyrosine-type recombinase/integrase [Terriglobales bacterium]
MDAKFEQFCKERQYLANVSPRTIEWYKESLKWLGTPDPTEDDLKAFVMRMRQKGLKATSCNNRIRAINAYLHWASGNSNIKCSPMCKHHRVSKLKEPQCVLPTFSQDDIKKFMNWKPKTKSRQRLQTLVLLLADTGVRLNEALDLKWDNVDLDNLLITVRGKGDKERKVPFSFELRRFLFKWKQKSEGSFLAFQTRTGNKLGKRVVLRDVKNLCTNLKIKIPARTIHAFRHSFALNYLRSGGSVFHLQRALGHSSLEMTRRYSNLQTSDLQAVHQRVSMLAAAH